MRARLGQGTGGLLVKGECPACGFFLTFFFLNKKLTHALVTHLNKMFVLKLKVFPIINNLVLFSRAGFLKVGMAHTDFDFAQGQRPSWGISDGEVLFEVMFGKDLLGASKARLEACCVWRHLSLQVEARVIKKEPVVGTPKVDGLGSDLSDFVTSM